MVRNTSKQKTKENKKHPYKKGGKGRCNFFLFILMGLLLISFIPSIEATSWTRTATYSDSDIRNVTFTNWWGLGAEQGKISLKSHQLDERGEIQTLQTGLGWQVTMYYDFEFYENLDDVLGDVEFINMKNGKSIDREWKFVYWFEEEREREVCSAYSLTETKNGTIEECSAYELEKYVHGEWQDYVGRDIKAKTIRIGVMVNNKQGDYIDGIWNIGSKRIDKHAAWTASLETDLISYYKLDETSGTNAEDSHGTNNGTASNSRVFTTEVAGKINTAGDFAESDQIDIGTTGNNLATMSISAWVYPTDLTSTISYIVGNEKSTASYNGFAFRLNQNGRFNWYSTGGAGAVTVDVGDILSINNWYHLVATYDGTNVRLYINGLEKKSGGVTGTIDSSGVNTLIGKSHHSGRDFVGRIDEVGIWSRALSSTEVEDLYNNGDGLNMDSVGLNIELLQPANNTFTSITEINFTANVTDNFVNITNVSLVIDDVIKQTNSSGDEGVYTFTETLTDGDYIWRVIGYDGSDEIYYSDENRTLTIVTDAPLIEAELNQSILYAEGDVIRLDYNITGAGLDTCWYNYNETNNTITCGTGLNTTITTTFSALNLTIYANNTLEFLSSESFNLTVDDIAPTIDLSYPTALIDYAKLNGTLELNFTATDTNLDSVWYDYNGTNVTITGASSGVYNQSNITLSDNINKNITIYANDTAGNFNSSYYEWDYKLFENEVIANSTSEIWVGISSNHYLTLNIEGITDYDTKAELIWNNESQGQGIKHIIDSNTIRFYNSFVVDDLGSDETINWTWNYTIKEGSSILHQNNISGNQSYYNLWIGVCNATYDVLAINYSFINEIDWASYINVDVLGNVKYLSEGEDIIFPIIQNNQSYLELCIYPEQAELTSDIYLSYKESVPDYSIRTYRIFGTTLNNETENITLYLIPFDESSRFTLTFMTGLSYLPDKYIRISRYRPELDQFVFVSEKTTDSSGKTSEWLLLDEIYRFSVLNQDRTLYGRSPEYTSLCPSFPCTETIFIDEDIDDWHIYQSPYATDIAYNFYFNRTSKKVHYEYEDLTGNAEHARLVVEKIDVRQGNKIICEVNTTGVAGELECDLSNEYDLEFVAYAYVSRSPFHLVATLRDSFVRVLHEALGIREGLFIGMLMVLVLGFIGSINPPVGIIMAVGGFAVGYALGLYTLTIPSVVAILLIGIILIMKMRGSPYD